MTMCELLPLSEPQSSSVKWAGCTRNVWGCFSDNLWLLINQRLAGFSHTQETSFREFHWTMTKGAHFRLPSDTTGFWLLLGTVQMPATKLGLVNSSHHLCVALWGWGNPQGLLPACTPPPITLCSEQEPQNCRNCSLRLHPHAWPQKTPGQQKAYLLSYPAQLGNRARPREGCGRQGFNVVAKMI